MTEEYSLLFSTQIACECINSAPDAEFLEAAVCGTLFPPSCHPMCSCWQVLQAAAGSIPLPPLHGWWPTGVLSVLRLFSAACCPRPQSGESSRRHQPTGQKFRELDLDGRCWELTQAHQIRTEPRLTLALHIHNPKISFMKRVNGDLLEITLSTKMTSTVIDNSPEKSTFKINSIPDTLAILSKFCLIHIFPQN